MKAQGIKIDFSSKGVKRRRIFQAKACLAAFIAVALTSYNIASYFKGRVELGRRVQEARSIERPSNARGKEKDAPPGGIGLKRSPHWTTLLTRLEERLPDKVVISGIKGALKDNRVLITGDARAVDKALLFAESLEKDGVFEGIVLTTRPSVYGNAGLTGLARWHGAVGFDIEAVYRPGGGG